MERPDERPCIYGESGDWKENTGDPGNDPGISEKDVFLFEKLNDFIRFIVRDLCFQQNGRIIRNLVLGIHPWQMGDFSLICQRV
jgi:hypothetical protein